ncbi:hypothetical protein U472_03185 [Orenia metallireducens]|uniref:Uncharacterized protein n=1 Tax=Orenia metallireducens TaxID=1413210 RepID=A0A1C0AB17_9FIRM|nr:hypothetical protein U472_03185 [Orenia metallireducens]
MIILIVVVFVMIIRIEIPKMIKEEYWRELVYYSLLLFIGFVLSILNFYNVDIISPIKIIESIIDKIF